MHRSATQYTATQYTATAKSLHWTMAVLIIALLAIGTSMVFLPKGDLRGEIVDLHKQLGVAVLALAVIRLAWRAAKGAPALPAATPALERLAAQAGHAGLYLLMFAMPLSGLVMSQAGGHPVHLLGLTLPDLVAKNHDLHELTEGMHEVLAWATGVLVGLHAAAALRHHLVLKDDVLRRMLPQDSR